MSTTRNMLLGQITESAKDYPVIGHMVWWSLRKVVLHQQTFAEHLRTCGFSDSFARTHNYRTAFIRALREMERGRVIRKIDETESLIRYQFTAESKTDTGADSELAYTKETIIVINKFIYHENQDFSAAIVMGDPDIKTRVVDLFNQAITEYNSGDLSRYIQRIFETQADLVSLRDQGSLYFVPIGFHDVLLRVKQLCELIGGIQFEVVPMLDVESARTIVSSAIDDETSDSFIKLAAEIEVALRSDKEITTAWASNRIDKVRALKSRVEMYLSVLGEKANPMLNNLDSLEEAILGGRVLDMTPTVHVESSQIPEPVA